MKNLTDPLEVEIQATTSWWVKIRNRLYITLMQQCEKAGKGHHEECSVPAFSDIIKSGL